MHSVEYFDGLLNDGLYLEKKTHIQTIIFFIFFARIYLYGCRFTREEIWGSNF